MIVDNYPRPEVTAEEYRELETLAMQRFLQLPLGDLGKCLIAFDIERNLIKRWLADERLPQHRALGVIQDAINEGTVVRLQRD